MQAAVLQHQHTGARADIHAVRDRRLRTPRRLSLGLIEPDGAVRGSQQTERLHHGTFRTRSMPEFGTEMATEGNVGSATRDPPESG